jgi:hypothetical protein
MIQRGSDTSFTNLWSLLLYIQSLLHYIENAQENKKNTIVSYNIAENSKRVNRNEEKVCVFDSVFRFIERSKRFLIVYCTNQTPSSIQTHTHILFLHFFLLVYYFQLYYMIKLYFSCFAGVRHLHMFNQWKN